jgi:hypothetical protein
VHARVDRLETLDTVEPNPVEVLPELATGAHRDVADDPASALNELLRIMIGAGGSKLALAGLLDDASRPPTAVRDAAAALRSLAADVLLRAQDAGVADPDVSIEEVYVLLHGLAAASATGGVEPALLARAVRIVQRGVARG